MFHVRFTLPPGGRARLPWLVNQWGKPGGPEGGRRKRAEEADMRRITLVGLGFALLLAMPARAEQGTGAIAGSVADPDGQGLPGVLVVVTGGAAADLQVVSGYDGIFRANGLAPGTYTVRAELQGFEPVRAEAVRVQPGATTGVRLAFSKLVFHESVEVTSQHEALTVSEVRESAARDIGEAIVDLPGIAKVRKGGIANDIVLRGLQRDNINVLVDGEKLYGACPNRMDSPAFHVDFAEVDHVEVTRGPFDIENQGSLGGIVNIVTRKPNAGFHGTATLVGGSAGYVNPSLTASWAGAGFAASAGYSYRASDPYRDGAGRLSTEVTNYAPDQKDTSAFEVNTAWAKLYLTPRPGHELEVSYTRQEADQVLYPGLLMDAGWDNADRAALGWYRSDDEGAVRQLRVRAYATRVRHWMDDSLRTSGVGKPTGWSMASMAEASTLGGKADAEVWGFKVGVEAIQRTWDMATRMAGMGYASQAAIPDVTTTGLGLFASRRLALAERLDLDLGARLDRSRTAADPDLANTDLYFAYNSTRSTARADTLPSAMARLTWIVSPRLEIAGGVGRTVRVPDPAERYFALKRASGNWVGNPEVRPTRNTGLDLQTTWRADLGSLGASLFYERLGDFIAVHEQPRVNAVPGVANSAARSYTNVDARMWGGEVELNRALTQRVFLGASVSYTRGTKETAPDRYLYSSNLAEIPPLSSRVLVRYDTGRFYAETVGTFVAAQDKVDTDLLGDEETPGFAVMDLKAGATLFGFRLQAVLANVFDRTYREHLACTRDPFHAGVQVFEPGRTFTLNVIRQF